MKILEKINIYLNESKIPYKMVEKAISYVDKKYPDADVNIIWNDGKKWYQVEYEFGDTKEYTTDDFEKIGIGNEEEWDSEQDKGLAKVLRAKKAYIMEL